MGRYDLEVEAMDLQAETQSARTVIVGKGGTSEFGDDDVLETVDGQRAQETILYARVKQPTCRMAKRKRQRNCKRKWSWNMEAYGGAAQKEITE